MTSEFEMHLPGAQVFYAALTAAAGPAGFSAIAASRLNEVDGTGLYYGYILPSDAAVLSICDSIMRENPGVTFQQALDPFRAMPQNFVPRETAEFAAIMQRDEADVSAMMRRLGFHVEEGLVTHHASMHRNYTKDILRSHRPKKDGPGL